MIGPEHTTAITTEGSHHRVPSLPATVADRTGAQDGFVAGYLMSRRAGAAPVAAVDAAHRVMSQVLARVGPTTQGGPFEA